MSLKYTNANQTSATLNGASFTLASPGDWDSIGDGPTREAVKAWLAAGNTPLPADAPTLDDVKDAKKAEIRAYRDNLLLLTPFNGKLFQTDTNSKIQIMVIAGQTTLLPSAAKWRTADNTYADMTLELFQQLMSAIMQREGAAFTNSSAHQDSVDALTDVAAVKSYDFSTGWPA